MNKYREFSLIKASRTNEIKPWIRNAAGLVAGPFTLAAVHAVMGCYGGAPMGANACGPLEATFHPEHIEIGTATGISSLNSTAALAVMYKPGS
jgi:hypothetical protein